MSKKTFCCLLAVFALWAALHLFLNWGMPALAEPVADAVPASPELDAAAMMRADTCKYGPLQYIILDFLSPSVPKENILDAGTYLAAVSKRIVVFRAASAAMQFGTALFVFLFAFLVLRLAPVWSVFAAALFLLVPASLFYSLTTNMDIPYIFWFTGAVFFAVIAERHPARRKRYVLFHLLAGFFLAASFCTKDQVYAACLLPAALFAVWKFRTANGCRFFAAGLPFLLWICAFLAGMSLIYAAAGGWETAVRHFCWITGSGRQGFQQTDGTIFGRMQLIWDFAAGFARMFDIPMLVLLTAFAALSALNRKQTHFNSQSAALLVFLSAAILSFHLFFTQTVRFNHTRYALLFLPFAVILAASFAARTDRRVASILAGAVLAAQIWTASELLRAMNYLPMVEVCRAYAEHPEWKHIRTATVSASEGFYYRADKTPSAVHAIRHWSAAYVIPNALQTDLFPSEPYFAYLKPKLLLLSGNRQTMPEIQAILNQAGFELAADFLPASMRVITLFDAFQPESIHLYYLPPGAPELSGFPLFAVFSLDWQLAQMTDFLPGAGEIPRNNLIPLGRSLAKFQTPDTTNYNISSDALLAAGEAYHAAGRQDDANAVRKFIHSAWPAEK